MPSGIEVMSAAGMVTLNKVEHLEVLESLCQRIDTKLELFGRNHNDEDQADALELIALYNKLNVGAETPPVDGPELREIARVMRTPVEAPARKRKSRK